MNTLNTVALISYSGNAGKTTLARCLFARHMPEAALVSVESINADGQEAVTMRGKQFSDLLDAIAMSVAGVIVDVGASNVEDFLQRMTQTRRSHQQIDRFVVPVMPGAKQCRDAIATIEALSQIGVPAQRIAVVCNGLDATDTVESAFAPLLAYLQAERKACLISQHVSDSEVFGRLVAANQTLAQALAIDSSAERQALRATIDPTERLAIGRRLSLHGMAESASEELDKVWAEVVSL